MVKRGAVRLDPKVATHTLLGLLEQLVQHTSISFDRVTLAHLDSIAFVEWLRLF